jgi:hypothetical protein
MRHSKTEDIFVRMSSYYSLPGYPFIGQLCIVIPTNRSTPYRMLVAVVPSSSPKDVITTQLLPMAKQYI